MDLIQNFEHVIIDGPIQIAKKNFVTKLDYSDNFEVSFEFKASSMPTNGVHHQILVGKLISFEIKISVKIQM